MAAQILVQRIPTFTPEQFSDRWLNGHAPLVVPLFLFCGVQNYTQVHKPFSTPSTPELNLDEWDGAGEVPLTPLLNAIFAEPESGKAPSWAVKYSQEVVVVDERKFLVSEALGAKVKAVPEGTIIGDRKDIIKDGKPVIEVSEEVWRVWREYEAMGAPEGY